MNGARFVHDQLELAGWPVAIADAQKVKGLAPLACKTDQIDAWVLPRVSRRDLVPEIWLPTLGCGPNENGTVPAAPSPPPDRAQEPHPRHLLASASLARSATCSAPAAASCWPV